MNGSIAMTIKRLVFGVLLLGLGLAALPMQSADAGAPPSVTATYEFGSGGYVRVEGYRFAPGASIEVGIYDDSWDFAASPSEVWHVTADKTGHFVTWSTLSYCPRRLFVYGQGPTFDDPSTSFYNAAYIRDSRCPW